MRVKDGHLTKDLNESNFSGVVSRESLRIAFTYAALNNINVYAGDNKYVYLWAPTLEEHFIICSEEFPFELQGRVTVICRALYNKKVLIMTTGSTCKHVFLT